MALSTGETWFKVPKSILINFAGAPAFGMSGKDVILHILKPLAKVEASVAVYPNPDDVVPMSEKAGMDLDGVFIGACTPTEEELVLAALVLKVGRQKKPSIAKGKKHYVPDSLPVVEKLGGLDLLEVYEEAGFTRGAPGYSYCVGMSAEKTAEGKTWLSSQNRNFKNRMGKGEPRTSNTTEHIFGSQWLILTFRLFRKRNLHYCLCSFQFQHVRDGSSTVPKDISESYKMYGKATWEKLTESELRVKVGDDTDEKIVDKLREW